MNKFIALLLVFQISIAVSLAQPYQVGHMQKTFVDASRPNRNINVEIYYPADVSGNNVAISAGQFPTLVFGHGFLTSWSAYDVEWNGLVPNGYIMIFPTTEMSFSPSIIDFAKDIAFLTSAMKVEGANPSSPFYGSVTDQSALMGHSMGGGCSFLAIQYDSTITALATLAPAVTSPSPVTAASSISIPALILAGANDCITPPSTNQVPLYDSLGSYCKTLVTITGGSHCQFASYNFNCSLGELSCSPQATITPTVQQSITLSLLLPWLNFYLKDDCQAGIQFQGLISEGEGIVSQQNCTVICNNTDLGEKDRSSEISIFPNPIVNEATIITIQNFNNSILCIYNSLGQQVWQTCNVSEKEIKLQTSNWPAGFYLLRVTNNNYLIDNVKFIISK
jgi:pimeloyl-ACP methyl ester carboxylesterase